jgi:hypothetical protein
MAEPVSLIASITSIAAISTKASSALYNFASDVTSAGEDASRLGDEVTALSLVLGQLVTGCGCRAVLS